MWHSKSATNIQQLLHTDSTFLRGYSSKELLQATTRSQPPVNPHLERHGGSFRGLPERGNQRRTHRGDPIFFSGREESQTGSRRALSMDRVLLHVPSNLYEEVLAHLLGNDVESESAGFMFVLPGSHTDDVQVYRHVEWHPVPPDGFVENSSYHLELTDEFRASIVKRAHDIGASIVEFHSHLGPHPARFSPFDRLGLREFVPHVRWRLRKRPYFAVVVTHTDFDCLAWMADTEQPQHIDGIVVGDTVFQPTRLSSIFADSERYDRNARFFGQGGQDALRAATVAVVGVGGLGTHVVQQLSLLGVGRLVLIDSEDIHETNRNRYVGLRHDDHVPGLPKVDLGRRFSKEVNPDVEVVSVAECLRSRPAFEAIIESDYVFGCLDNDGSRLILNELCLAYAKPYFDLASDIVEGGTRYGGRVCVVGNDAGCLVCYDELDLQAAQIDLMSHEQRRDYAEIYGIPLSDLGRAGPSVVSINGVVASLGVTEFVITATGVPRQPRKVLKYYGERGVVTIPPKSPDPDCYHCSGIRGKGNEVGVQRYLKAST